MKTEKKKKVTAGREEKSVRNETIKKAISNGASTRDLGVRYGISNKRIWDIANKKADKTPNPKKKKSKR
jgi:Mor family transcriptional regulator